MNFLCFSLLIFGYYCFNISKAQKVPAMYVFGDSLVDVGTNNYLTLSIAKADFPHNGVDFPSQKATGRFSNGKNAADFLAEKVGLATSPPYLSLVTLSNGLKENNILFPLTGVSFASGGAGIFDTTGLGQSVPLTKQIKQYTKVNGNLVQQLGTVGAQNHLSKSLFTIIIGNNDLLVYFSPVSDLPIKSDTQQFVDTMVLSLKDALKKIYNLGARKFMIAGVGAIGCTPAMRNQNKVTKNECNEEANYWSVQYNQGLQSMLHDIKNLELKDMNYAYVDIFKLFTSFLQSPSTYGFSDVKSACCGLGNLRADIPCVPISEFCSNRNDHAFWDLFHPSEAAASIFINTVFNGSAPYAIPINVEQLIVA